LRPISLLFACLLSAPAFAADFYLESAELSSKADANDAAEAAEEAGLGARVVRRLGKGSGWRYVVRVEGFGDSDDALDAADELAAAVGESVGVYEVDRGRAQLVEEVRPSGDARSGATAAKALAHFGLTEVEAEDALPFLERAAKAHKVKGLDLDNSPVRFAFRRLLGEGGVADHTVGLSGGDLYVEVQRVSGDVVPSRLKVVGDKAWLSVDGGPWTEQNGEKARQTAEAMGPTKVLPFILVLDAAMDSRRELQRMETAGRADLEGVEVEVLDFAGDQAAGPVRVDVAVEDDLVQRVVFDAGALTYWFGDHKKVGAFQLPGEVVTEREGEVVDRVEIQELEVGGKVPSSWFAAP